MIKRKGKEKTYKNIFLIGFMGAGKTSVGRALAKKLKMRFVDLDEEIEKGLRIAISEIFLKFGEAFFRDSESEVLLSVAQASGQVVATGGGVVLRQENWEVMKKEGITVYLKAPIEVLWNRIKNETSRPLLQVDEPLKRARELISSRISLYEKADLIVDTEKLTPQKAAGEVVRRLKAATK